MAACVTRILELRGFDSKIKTRDIHAAFADLGETFKIKWIDDNGLYLVFNDAVTAKRVFLQCLGSIPYQLTPAPKSSVTLMPYKGSDAQAIIAYTQRGPRSERANSIASQDTSMALATGSVSPAVSMMLLAAAAATGPPGTLGGNLNGTHGTGFPPIYQQQHFNGYPFSASQASNGSLYSSYSQGNIPNPPDTLSFGYSMSGILNGSMSASSSWSNSSAFSSNQVNPRSGPPSQTNGFPISHSGLENIAEDLSREEISHSQMTSNSTLMTPFARDNLTSIVITESTPVVGADLEKQQARAMEGGGGMFSHHGKTSSDTEQSGAPWLSREPYPAHSLPSLHEQPSLSDLIDGTSKLAIQDRNPGGEGDEPSSEGERYSNSAYSLGISTPPEGRVSPGKTATPPRIGNPGKRMLGAALGIRHPSLPPRVITRETSTVN